MLKIYSGVGRGPLELFIKQLLEILALRSGIFSQANELIDRKNPTKQHLRHSLRLSLL